MLKTKAVAETPAHKQKSNIVWRRQEMLRRRSHTVADVHVIQESPDKAVHSTGERFRFGFSHQLITVYILDVLNKQSFFQFQKKCL